VIVPRQLLPAALLGAALLPAAGAAVAAAAGTAAPTGPQVLMRRCLSCHGEEKKTAGVDLSRRAGALALGVGKPETQNRILRAVASGRMPPTGKLPAAEIAALRAWSAGGARYPQEPLHAESLADQPLWSLAPIRRPAPPRSRFDGLARNPVDRFVFAKLAQAGLRPSPPAGRAQLLRRVTVDLTGLPPTPEETDAFLADRSANAYEKVVDRLLASPGYGERWGRHWLDVVRFGESHGYEQNHLRPTAWPYRDYVIRALNEDKPFDAFMHEQLAGDVLGKGDPWTEAATGFLVAGVHDTVGNQTVEGQRQQRANDLDDMVSTTGEAFLGLTVGCAKCHDHKFDPIPQRDYYRLAAVFAGVRHGERSLAGAPALPGNRQADTFPPETARFLRFSILETADGAEPCLDEIEVYAPDGGPNLALASTGAKASASSLLPGYPIHQIAHLNDGRLGNDHSWISGARGTGWAMIEFPGPVRIGRVVWSRDGANPPRFKDRTPALYRLQVSDDGKAFRTVFEGRPFAAGEVRAGMRAYSGVFNPPEPVHVLKRGDVMQRAEEVTPGALSRLPALPADLPAATEPERRLALARWLTDPRNPLTARVLVNRVWHHHFGRGLVATPSDFGHNGEKPSHPELLDWLAEEFRAPQTGKAWSLKRLHRLLVTSYTYRQAGAPEPKGLATDAGNVLLWRMPLRRMEAEAVRDAILAVSGKLDRRMGGPSYPLFKYRVVNVAIYEPLEEYGPETWRRTVYRQAARAIRDDLLGSLDCPDSSQRSPRRPSTTTALQALSLLNGPFVNQQAAFFAARVQAEAGPARPAQIARAFRLAFGRPPSADEAAGAADLAGKHGLTALCRALLNANEFLYF
jgi:mono/diheme cytochrome c family protein